MKFEDIQKANETIRTLDVKGKEYAEVNQRIKAFRMLYPQGFISTNMESNENGVCVFRATIGYYKEVVLIGENGNVETYRNEKIILGTGTAYEKENSTFINKTSYIENCETSAVGRALAMCGIGIDTSIASAEEVQNAITQQEESNKKPKEKETLKLKLEDLIIQTETKRELILEAYKVKDMNELTMEQMTQAIERLGKRVK